MSTVGFIQNYQQWVIESTIFKANKKTQISIRAGFLGIPLHPGVYLVFRPG